MTANSLCPVGHWPMEFYRNTVARRIPAEEELSLYAAWKATGSPAPLNKLLVGTQWLVAVCAVEMDREGKGVAVHMFQDMVGAGQERFLRMLMRKDDERPYNQESNIPLTAFCKPRVKGGMADFVREQAHVIRRPRKFPDETNAAYQARTNRFFAAMDQVLDIAEVEIPTFSLAQGTDVVGLVVQRQQVRQAFDDIASLPDRQRNVMEMIYGEDETLAAVSAKMGVTESRVCQIHGQALKALKVRVRNKNPGCQ